MPLRSILQWGDGEIRSLYDSFDAAIAAVDCGKKCAPHHSSGKPFCCDICHAVPAAYKSEWKYLDSNTDLWRRWRGDECGDVENAKRERARVQSDLPRGMILLACLGPDLCQRDFRALSCRQFPFFPYVTSDYRFIGLAYEWEFEARCWLISNLACVTQAYREEFVRTYDRVFALFQDEFDNYAYHSERMRAAFAQMNRRIPLLHRNGNSYRLSPGSERLEKAEAAAFPKFGPYQT